MKESRPVYKSLGFRLPVVLIASFIAIIIFVASLVYYRFDRNMINEYQRMAKGSTELAKVFIDADKITEYAEKGSEAEGYTETAEALKDIYRNYPDIHYLYVYRFEKDGGHAIFDIYTEEGEVINDEPGDIYKPDEPFKSELDSLMEGGTMPAQAVTDSTGEYLLSYINPIFDSEGNYACHVCVDFHMNTMKAENIEFVFLTLLLMLFFLLILGFADIYFVNRWVVGPLGKIVDCINNFKFKTEADQYDNVSLIESLNIQTDDEIGDLYNTFLSVLKENTFYTANLKKAKQIIEDNESKLKYMSQTMYKDELTRVGNKAAYNILVDEINENLQNKVRGSRHFAVVMVDINNLKYINDTFGHERGDEYIKGCCDIIAKIYAHSPIYRIGGDEFVIVLRDNDYDQRQKHYAKTMVSYNFAFKDEKKEPWERYSASLGMSECHGYEETFSDVFKRADADMYEAKAKFKSINGSYR